MLIRERYLVFSWVSLDTYTSGPHCAGPPGLNPLGHLWPSCSKGRARTRISHAALDTAPTASLPGTCAMLPASFAVHYAGEHLPLAFELRRRPSRRSAQRIGDGSSSLTLRLSWSLNGTSPQWSTTPARPPSDSVRSSDGTARPTACPGSSKFHQLRQPHLVGGPKRPQTVRTYRRLSEAREMLRAAARTGRRKAIRANGGSVWR
jgi:hypothetical protein